MMARAQLVSHAVEQKLARRISSPFSPRVRAEERIEFGIPPIDVVAHGGAPLGAITELVGGPCSGRTTAALSLLGRFTAEGNVCAWVDVADTLNPASAAVAGLDLKRLLWVRCGTPQPASESVLQAPGSEVSLPPPASHIPVGNSPHPRTEGQNMPQAIQAMLGAHGGLLDHQTRRERKTIGTPGIPNRPLQAAPDAQQEKLPTDRPHPVLNLPVAAPKLAFSKPRTPWQALDQALCATDLLLTNGGFAAIVLDLGSTPAEIAWRIPLATWFRYRAACERSRCSLLLLTQHPCARSSAGLVIRLQPGTMESEGPVMTGIRFQAELQRSRFSEQPSRVVPIRKAPQPERPEGSWRSESVWA